MSQALLHAHDLSTPVHHSLTHLPHAAAVIQVHAILGAEPNGLSFGRTDFQDRMDLEIPPLSQADVKKALGRAWNNTSATPRLEEVTIPCSPCYFGTQEGVWNSPVANFSG